MRKLIAGCLLAGLPVSAGLLLADSLLLCLPGIPAGGSSILAGGAVCAGCWAAGAHSARRRRQKGAFTGIFAGLAVWLFWYPAACLAAGRMQLPGLPLPYAFAGMLGGIWGVNRPAPRILRRSHRLRGIRERLRLAAAAMHKPPKQDT